MIKAHLSSYHTDFLVVETCVSYIFVTGATLLVTTDQTVHQGISRCNSLGCQTCRKRVLVLCNQRIDYDAKSRFLEQRPSSAT